MEYFSLPLHPDQLWGPSNLIFKWALGPLTPKVKRPGCESDNSPPSSAEVKVWSYTSTPCMPSWHGTYLSTETTLLFTFTPLQCRTRSFHCLCFIWYPN